jgi:hypothetical protein
MRSESNIFARSSLVSLLALSPLPARLMKYVSIRIPEAGPFAETFLEASERAIVAESWVNSPFSGWVESVVTLATQRLPYDLWFSA